jgi:hypothetical protein
MRLRIREQWRASWKRSLLVAVIGLLVLFGSCISCIWMLVPRDTRPTRHAKFIIAGRVTGYPATDEVRVTLSVDAELSRKSDALPRWQKLDDQGRFAFVTPEVEFKSWSSSGFSVVKTAYAIPGLRDMGFEVGIFLQGHPPIAAKASPDMHGWDWSDKSIRRFDFPPIDLSKTMAVIDDAKDIVADGTCGQGQLRDVYPTFRVLGYFCGAYNSSPSEAPGCDWLPIYGMHKVCLDPNYSGQDNVDEIRHKAQALFEEMDGRSERGTNAALIEFYRRFYQTFGKAFWWLQ